MKWGRGGLKARLYISRTCLYADGNDLEGRLAMLERWKALAGTEPLRWDPEHREKVWALAEARCFLQSTRR